MTGRHSLRICAGATLAVLLLGACAPQSVPSQPVGDQSAPSARPAGPKTLTIGVQREVPNFDPDLAGTGAGASGGGDAMRRIPVDELTAKTPTGMEPRLAQELPSTERGTWRLTPDGGMEMTWKLRPNIKWHDGEPFSSADLAFGFQVRRDPRLAILASGGTGRTDLMESVSTPDAQTLVVRWKAPYALGDEGNGLEPIAKHLLGDVYRDDIESVQTSRYLSTEYIGLGAYRLTRWEQGSFVEFAGFADYYLGRPHFDRIIMRFIPDVNALVANILSESIDIVLPDTVDVETAIEIRRRWEGTGNTVRLDPASNLQQVELQHRPEFSKPANGLTNRGVRQAFYHAIDRKTLSEVMTQGFAPVADSWYRPNHPLRLDVESAIPQFPYDVNRAQQLLTEAGWVRGADGVLVYGPTGDRFETELLHRSGTGFEKEANIVADNWKSIGAQVTLQPLTQQLSSDRQYQATRPGGYITMPTGEGFYDKRTHSSQIGRPETRWSGTNRAGYNNPRVDAILDKIAVTIDRSEQIPLHRQLLQEQMTDIAVMPLYWLISPILMLKGIRGPQMAYNIPNFNMWEWDRD